MISWAQILVDAVRAGGGYHPVSIGDGAWGVEVNGSDNGFRVRDIAGLVDFLGPHVYRMETDQLRQHLGAAFVCELLDFNNQPVVMEEFGVTSDYTSDENAAHYYRHTLHHTLLAGATGWITWNNTDYDDLFAQAPYSHHPFELHFGLVDKHGKVKPAAHEVKQFAELLERIDFPSCERPDTGIAMIVPSYLENQYPFTAPDDPLSIVDSLRQAYVAAREADLPVKLVREADGLLWQPAHVPDVTRGVAAGGTLYGRAATDPIVLGPGELDPRALGPGLPRGRRALPGAEREAADRADLAGALRARRGRRHGVRVVFRRRAQEPARPVVARPGRAVRREEAVALRPGEPHRRRDGDLRVRARLRFDRRGRADGVCGGGHREFTRFPAGGARWRGRRRA